jgi:5-methylcytosine-specific restriction endonuclease McrA
LTQTVFKEKFIKLYSLINWRLEMSNDHSRLKQEIIERIRSMVFLCMYCDSPNPIAVSVVDYEHQASRSYATAFFICPDCQNKFVVKIQDLGKVRK